jgi:DNA-binding XRE family transcriptional regulator
MTFTEPVLSPTKLANARVAKKMTQAKLAKLAGVSRWSIIRYEQGLTAPRILALRSMAKVLGVKPDDLCVTQEQ